MKLQFTKQEFQTNAVEAVAGLFKGQEEDSATFSIVDNSAQTSFLAGGLGNQILIDDKTLAENLNAIQKHNSLPLSDVLPSPAGKPATSPQMGEVLKGLPVSIEMETGTGKTYVYIKTILELNKRYGFSKFIIVVPSVAIREGVLQSFKDTTEHFKKEYPKALYNFFIYNSSRLNDVRHFARSQDIQIMIINIDAFKKAENVINQERADDGNGKIIKYLQDTNPVVIIDEPQSVDNTDKAKEAIASLNPLCVLRYSATHREKNNLVYRLTPVDAYKKGLVKQICVISNSVINDANKPYIALKSVSNANGFTAKIEIDVEGKDAKITRKAITIKPGTDLYLESGNRSLYEGYAVAGIDCTAGFEGVEFANGEYVALGKAIGSVDDNVLKRSQIYHTIKTHFDKELRYFAKDIKVLSLFFIDEVKKYRTEDGEQGIYAKMFEECYNELLAKPKYAPLKELFNTDVVNAHDGYFSQDKKGAYKNTKGDTQADDTTYNVIMKDKKKLLSFDCPLRFIFSHSALKEGWDNPNVFQVCTLLEQKSVFTCRQKIGRGLRLCVNQQGERIEDKNINILHVVANENFADFADKLQKEIEAETGMKFGTLEISNLLGLTYEEEVEVEKEITQEQAQIIVEVIEASNNIEEANIPEPIKEQVKDLIKEEKPISVATLVNKTYTEVIKEEKTVDYAEAVEMLEDLKEQKIISKDGKIKDTMKEQLKAGTLDLGERWSNAKKRAVLQAVQKADNKPVIRDASKEVSVKLKKQAFISPEFMELWNKIKQKTTYRVQFDLEELTKNAIKDLKAMPPIATAKIMTQTAGLDVAKAGITHVEQSTTTEELKQNYYSLPDILRLISIKTLLKRSTVNKIIQDSGRAKDFLKNPQEFYEKALEIIEKNRHALAIDGIKYIKLAGEEYYMQEIFESQELIANLDKNAVAVNNSVYDHVIYDSSTVELPFAKALDNDPEVKMFFKIPSRFKIETPIGTYNPDWAVYLEKNGEHKLYFVLETKGSSDFLQLRPEEKLKIHCGEQHFKALENNTVFPSKPVVNWQDFKKSM
ncbi:MAG: DEAD/DEAH box helicase family protein [Alphaproteobacteria bacterium]